MKARDKEEEEEPWEELEDARSKDAGATCISTFNFYPALYNS